MTVDDRWPDGFAFRVMRSLPQQRLKRSDAGQQHITRVHCLGVAAIFVVASVSVLARACLIVVFAISHDFNLAHASTKAASRSIKTVVPSITKARRYQRNPLTVALSARFAASLRQHLAARTS